MHSAALKALGRSERYVAIHVPVNEVIEALDHLVTLGYLGINVTVPHKETVIPWLADLDSFAARVRAVNTICLRGRYGLNTDGPGFLEVLAQNTVAPGSRILMLGAGGSARAVAEAMTSAGFDLTIWNRTTAKAIELARAVGAITLEKPTAVGFDAVVNTTSASLQGNSVPLDWDGFSGIALDLMYQEGHTPFLAQAASRGLQTVDGRSLLVAQGALSLEHWLRVAAPRSVMREAIQ
jgi:shikimate dehydrogenase